MSVEKGALYRPEITDAGGKSLLSALLPQAAGTYRAPPWLRERAATGVLRWRVIALNEAGQRLAESLWRTFSFRETSQAKKSAP